MCVKHYEPAVGLKVCTIKMFFSNGFYNRLLACRSIVFTLYTRNISCCVFIFHEILDKYVIHFMIQIAIARIFDL